METLDLVRIGADGSSHWSRVWPIRRRTRVTPGWNCGCPLTGLGLIGSSQHCRHQIVGRPASCSIGVTTITADCSWRPRDLVRLERLGPYRDRRLKGLFTDFWSQRDETLTIRPWRNSGGEQAS